MSIRKVSLEGAFAGISEHWSPRIGGDINESQIKLAKFAGKFDWHHHEHEDELFLVIKGTMRMGLRDGDIDVAAGEFIIVPKGVEHCPEAISDECHVVLLEPRTTINTGNVVTDKTVTTLGRVD
jgi:mannose-6-phosphate isomerase-like protein (cupin superfamily)